MLPHDGGVTRRHMPAWIALGGAVLVGVLTAVQARINGQLGLRLDDGLVAAAISFGSGLLILIVLSLVLPVGRRGFATLTAGIRSRGIPWWMLAGGAAGALTVATQGLAVGIIGVSLFTVGVVAGQAVCGLVLDRIGYGPAGVVAVTMPRVAGGALALLAVGIVARRRRRSPASRCGCWCCRSRPASASRGSRRRTGGCVSASGRR